MIIIDASTVFDAFREERLRNRILMINKPLRAPTQLIREIANHKSVIMKWAVISHKEFENTWQAFLGKIIFEDPTDNQRREAKEIIETLHLDARDRDYLALCLKYQQARPTFWTQDTPFVFGEVANCLRKEYNIFGNFNV